MSAVRRAEKRDIPAILQLLVQVNMVHHTIRPDLFNGPATKYTQAEMEGLLTDEQKPIFVYEDEEGRVQGHCFCSFQQFIGHNIRTDAKTLHIDDLCVDENARGRHIGKTLYEYAVAFARENGCYNVTLNVWAGNDSALGFYQRQGLQYQKYGMEMIL